MKSASNQRTKAVVLTVLGILILALGLFGSISAAPAAQAENATDPQKMSYSLSLIGTVAGVILLVIGLVQMKSGPLEKKKTNVHTLALASLFAALCYIGFTFFKIDIPVGAEKTAFHLGNVFCVLAALLIGGFWGGMAGAVGMTIADLTTAYVTSAPKTFVLKLCIGLIVGLVANRCFHLDKESNYKRLTIGTVVSCVAGMAFNVVADPVVGYFYKTYVLGVPQEAAKIWAKMGAITTMVNAVIAVVTASVFYLALRPALKRAGLLQKIQ